jgi:hypothetical protein
MKPNALRGQPELGHTPSLRDIVALTDAPGLGRQSCLLAAERVAPYSKCNSVSRLRTPDLQISRSC